MRANCQPRRFPPRRATQISDCAVRCHPLGIQRHHPLAASSGQRVMQGDKRRPCDVHEAAVEVTPAAKAHRVRHRRLAATWGSQASVTQSRHPIRHLNLIVAKRT